jgi:hypothetical protein
MAEVQVVVKVDVESPEISKIFESMTVEDKRDLASKIAYQYFVKQMDDGGRNNSYYGHQYESRIGKYLTDLSNHIRGHISDTIKSDPELKTKVDCILTQIQENKEKFVQEAVTSAMGKLIGGILLDGQSMQQQMGNINMKIDSFLLTQQ